MEVFGIEHIIYMIVSLVVMIIALVLFKKFIPKDKTFILIKILAGIGLVLIIINRIVVSLSRDGTFLDFIPDTFCSTMGFVLPLVVLLCKPESKIFQFALFAGFFGGILTFFYPDFLVYFDDIFNIHPFTGLLYHTFMMFIFIASLVLGYFKPSFKKWTSFVTGLAFLVVWGSFGNTALGQSNNMYLNAPLISGTPFTWWLTGILLIILYTVIIQIYEMFTLPVKEWSIILLFNKLKQIFTKKKKIADNTTKDEQN